MCPTIVATDIRDTGFKNGGNMNSFFASGAPLRLHAPYTHLPPCPTPAHFPQCGTLFAIPFISMGYDKPMSQNVPKCPTFQNRLPATPFAPGRRSKSPIHPLRLDITAQIAKTSIPHLSSHLKAAHALLRPALRELSVVLVNDAAMSALHKQYLGISGPTDVLTFELDHDHRGRVISGEVVICVPQARGQAKIRGLPFGHELLLYAIHGMLHLCGFDDKTARGFREMHRLEDELLMKLGIGRVFKPDGAPKLPQRRRAKGEI